MQLCEKFNFAAKLLVEANLERQENIMRENPTLGPKALAKEFCTVKLSSGRRSGTSYTAIDLAVSFFKKPLILCANEAMAKLLKKQIAAKDSNNSYVVCSVFNNLTMQGLSPDAVIIDGAGMVPSSRIEDIYDMFKISVVNAQGCFIFLG